MWIDSKGSCLLSSLTQCLVEFFKPVSNQYFVVKTGCIFGVYLGEFPCQQNEMGFLFRYYRVFCDLTVKMVLAEVISFLLECQSCSKKAVKYVIRQSEECHSKDRINVFPGKKNK